MSITLTRIAEMSRERPDMVFTSIAHVIDKDLLMSIHGDMDGKKAVGIDGITKEEYDKNLEDNVEDLLRRIRNKQYRPKPAIRVEIPKDNGKTRPLNIYSYEDKLVQAALKEILEAVFEPQFYNEMMGFRPKRNCHMAIGELNRMIEKKYTNYIVDCDIKGFFDHLDQNWCIKFIESRIKDPRIIRLVRVTLKSGIMIGFEYDPTEEGSGQGSVCSPVIANIYMHYVLLWWFKERFAPKQSGYCGIIVYADDFVVCFQHKTEAAQFYDRLRNRLKIFGLQIEEEKSRLIEFGRYADMNSKNRGKGAADTFTFLGFTHYCSKSRYGTFRVKRRTSRKKFTKKCKEIRKELRLRIVALGQPFKEVHKWISQVLVGYFNYYAITDNSPMLSAFVYEVRKMIFYFLNRRSQRKSMTWEVFNRTMNERYPLPKWTLRNVYEM